MANTITSPLVWDPPTWMPLPKDIPILYEDEEEGDMGEVNYHVLADEIVHICLNAHFDEHLPEVQVFSNMNLYYLDGPPHPVTGSAPYVSPDAMAVKAYQRLPASIRSYKIGRDGPPPLATAEILSDRSAQQRDLKEKMVVYRMLKIPEYLLIDPTGKHLAERLLLKRLGADGEYHDERDADGGITSRLGFRLIFEPDGLRVIHAATGRRYVRPMEAERAEKERRIAEAARVTAEGARQAEEQARKAAEQAYRAAEEARLREAEARAKADADLAAAQERLRALEAELARFKKQD